MTRGLIVQCEFCGRIKLDKAWGRLDVAVPDVVAICPTCAAAEERKRRIRAHRLAMRVGWKADRGLLPREPDPFKGFRGGKE